MKSPTLVTVWGGFTKRWAIALVGIVALAVAALLAYDSLVEPLPAWCAAILAIPCWWILFLIPSLPVCLPIYFFVPCLPE